MKYEELVGVYKDLEKTSKRLEKIYYISELLKKTPMDDLKTIVLLLQGRIFPVWDERKIGVATRLVLKSINIATGIPADKIEDEWKKKGELETLLFKESGWFLVRAITDNSKTFRFASTAPYYVEMGETKRRISKTSAQFFLDWVRERAQRVKLDDPLQRAEVLEHHDRAEKFWLTRVSQANAE